MAKKVNDQQIDVYRNSMTYDQYNALRLKLAKRANQRMVRLERAKSEITGESYADYGAYQQAKDYLSRQKRNRFVEKGYRKSLDDMRREITQLQSFLNAKSSTVAGQKAIEKSRVQTFESGQWGAKWKATGIPQTKIKFANNKEFYDFLNSSTFTELVKSGFTSDQIVELFELASERNDQYDAIINKMEDALETFREKGNADLKTLTKSLGLSPLQ